MLYASRFYFKALYLIYISTSQTRVNLLYNSTEEDGLVNMYLIFLVTLLELFQLSTTQLHMLEGYVILTSHTEESEQISHHQTQCYRYFFLLIFESNSNNINILLLTHRNMLLLDN